MPASKTPGPDQPDGVPERAPVPDPEPNPFLPVTGPDPAPTPPPPGRSPDDTAILSAITFPPADPAPRAPEPPARPDDRPAGAAEAAGPGSRTGADGAPGRVTWPEPPAPGTPAAAAAPAAGGPPADRPPVPGTPAATPAGPPAPAAVTGMPPAAPEPPQPPAAPAAPEAPREPRAADAPRTPGTPQTPKGPEAPARVAETSPDNPFEPVPITTDRPVREKNADDTAILAAVTEPVTVPQPAPRLSPRARKAPAEGATGDSGTDTGQEGQNGQDGQDGKDASAGQDGKVAARPAPRPKDPRRKKKLRLALVAFTVVLLLIVGAVGWWGWALSRASFPKMSGNVAIEGLTGEVEVLRDSKGIPQIYADNPADLFRAQGYVHAQDRFWEMDVRRHATAGRLSEMFGADQVDNDKFLRTLGWHRVAEQELAKLPPETVKLLEAYAGGVNAYLKDHKGKKLSFEYALLGTVNDGYKPEPWKPVDSLAWLKAMAWDLRTNLQDEIDRALLSDKLTANQIDELYPPYPYERNQPIVPTGGIANDRFQQDAPQSAPSRAAQNALADLSKALEQLPSMFSQRSSGVGSNSWVVAGSRTTTGKPLLANDPHLSPSLPSVWYQMGLHCRTVSAECPYDVSGFTFSGTPGVIIGHNARIAWGFTNLGADVTDLYLEKVNDTGYLYGSGYVPFEEVRTEEIKVAGGSTRTITVRSTRHGPILSGESDELEDVGREAPIPDPGPQREDGFAVALRWTALEPGTTMDSVFQLNRATDWNSFREALRGFDAPSQNVIYADVDGNIGYQAPGRIPIRHSGDGRWPAYGWDPNNEWDSYIPFDQLPNRFNPPEGYIVTANNAVTGPTYPYTLTTDWGYGARSQRILDMLADGQKVDAAAMQRMQTDDLDPMAQVLVPHLLEVRIDDPWVREAQDLLRGWDFRTSSDSRAAAYYNAVWRNLLMLAFGDKMPWSVRADNDCGTDARGDTVCGERDDSTALPDGGDRWFEVVRNLLPDAESPWWNISKDPGRITTRDGLLSKAMTDARKELTAKLGKDMDTWSWGRLHTLELENQTLGTAGPGVVQWMLNRGPYEIGGGDGLVNATSWNAAQGYRVTTVPSMRMVVDLANFDESRWINLTGASGHVWHDNYTDQTELWRKGKTLAWPFSRAAVDEATRNRLTLTPAAPS